MKIGGTACKTN